MIKASSSGDHLVCFLAGVSNGWADMLRFPPLPLGCDVTCGGMLAAVVTGGSEYAPMFVCWGLDDGSSFESEAPRRWEISTLTVLMDRAVKAGVTARSSEYPCPKMLLVFSLLSS